MRSLTNEKKIRIDQVLKFASVILLAWFPLISGAEPKTVDTSIVQNCQFLYEVEGSSGYGKKINWMRDAKSAALSKAEMMGASHIVWDRIYPVGAFNGIAVAKAYRCNS